MVTDVAFGTQIKAFGPPPLIPSQKVPTVQWCQVAGADVAVPEVSLK